MCACARVCASAYVCICVCTYVCGCLCICACMCACESVRACLWMYMRVHSKIYLNYHCCIVPFTGVARRCLLGQGIKPVLQNSRHSVYRWGLFMSTPIHNNPDLSGAQHTSQDVFDRHYDTSATRSWPVGKKKQAKCLMVWMVKCWLTMIALSKLSTQTQSDFGVKLFRL